MIRELSPNLAPIQDHQVHYMYPLTPSDRPSQIFLPSLNSAALRFSHASSQEAFLPLSISAIRSLMSFSSAAYLTMRSGASSKSIFITLHDLVTASGAWLNRYSYLS